MLHFVSQTQQKRGFSSLLSSTEVATPNTWLPLHCPYSSFVWVDDKPTLAEVLLHCLPVHATMQCIVAGQSSGHRGIYSLANTQHALHHSLVVPNKNISLLLYNTCLCCPKAYTQGQASRASSTRTKSASLCACLVCCTGHGM